MEEIKVVPYIPDEDYDNPAMVVDFYEFTMANCLFLHGFKNTTLVFDMFFRKNPDNQGYSISAGQRKLTRFLLNYHFNEQDVHWLRTKGMSEEFCEYLRTYRWQGDMYALPEGTVCYPHVQMVRIECDLVGAILIETYLLQTMNFHSLIATKATRITGLNTRFRIMTGKVSMINREQTCEEHLEILDAATKGDWNTAADALQKHLEIARDKAEGVIKVIRLW